MTYLIVDDGIEREATPDEIADIEQRIADAATRGSDVPKSVTMRQARLALLAAGLLDDVDAAIAAIVDESQRRAAQIEWDYSSEVYRDRQLVAVLAPALGLNDAQLDNLFINASKL